MNKNENMKKILSSCIVLTLVLTAFGTMLLTQAPQTKADVSNPGNEPLLRIYGEENAVYPTQSYYGADDFVYPMEYDPYDPGIIEKDSITFNPAYLDGHGLYEIKAQGDASEKVFLRAFYEPGYTHEVDALMDAWSDVTLHPVETFDAIVTETTYHLVTLYDRDPTVGYPGATQIMLPYTSTNPMIPGMEKADLLDVVYTSTAGTRQLTDGNIMVEKTFQYDNINLSQDTISLSFMDHEVTIYNFENGGLNSLDQLDLDVSYIGNMYKQIASTKTHTIWEDSWGPGYKYFFNRENNKTSMSDPAYRWYLYINNADEDYLRITLGRHLAAGETFYVDGVRYDMPAVYVCADGGFKYITFQSPIPKGPVMWTQNPIANNVDDFSHVTSQYLASLDMNQDVWLLPPFNGNHWMVDDIGLPEVCPYHTLNGLLLDDEKEALGFYYVDETIEERFDSSLSERLYTDEEGNETWQWYNIHTLPNGYTEFVLPDQETPTESDGNEYLITTSYIAPNSEVDVERDDTCKGYEDHEIFDRVITIALNGERSQYYEMPRYVYEFDAYNPIDFYVNEGRTDPSVRIYGEPYFNYPTQSYTGVDDFIYLKEFYPFDPGVILKDSITFNPAFIDGHGGQFEIKAQGDASEKIFLRAFYEPCYGHPVDALMDAWTDVTLYPVETFDAIVTETTYHLVTLYDRNPTMGYAGDTKVVLPYASLNNMVPGMEEYALLDVAAALNSSTPQLTDGQVQVEMEFEFLDDSYIGQPIRFMDHEIEIVNFEQADYYNYDHLDLRVSYIGNMYDAIASTDTHTIWEDTWGNNFNFFFDRENEMQQTTDPAHRWYLRVENADEDYLRITLGRHLAAGETFYVDGVRYDMPAIYVCDDGGFKYITFQSPIPKGDPVWDMPLSKNVDDFSHVTSQYLASLPQGDGMWFLPPFNKDHWMIDDIDLVKHDTGCIFVPLNGILLEDMVDSLDFYYIDETTEDRFDTSLTQRLKTYENGNEVWQWYDVFTKPYQYTEFVLEDQETPLHYYLDSEFPSGHPIPKVADGNEYLITSSLIAPNSHVDYDRSNDCKAYDEHEIYSTVRGGPSGNAQICLIVDGSGSIDPSSWSIMVNGIADAIRDNIPHDGSVELTIIQFASSAQVEVGPVVVTEANYESLATTIAGTSQFSGGTSLDLGIDLATTTLLPNVGNYPRQLINIVTDGYPNSAAAAVTARDNMISVLGFDSLEDEIDAEAVGFGPDIAWLRDSIVWPQPGYDIWPPAGSGWVRPVASFEEFSDTIGEKIDLLIGGQTYPRYAFEFDADDGTGFFINENTIQSLPPIADAGGPYSGSIETSIMFDGSGSYDQDEGGSSIVQYDWRFYDGDSWHIGLGAYPTHMYFSPGTYTVTLRVTDDEGATDTDTAIVTVGQVSEPPIADAGGPYAGGIESLINFDGSGSYDQDEGGASIVSYAWDFGDGSTDTGVTPSHMYMLQGTYTVTLTVTDDEGATDTDATTVIISNGGVDIANIEMTDVTIVDQTGYGYLEVTGVVGLACSFDITVSYDPMVVQVLGVDGSAFDVIQPYIDNNVGELTIVGYNTNVELSGDFTMARIQFQAIGSPGQSCDLEIENSLLQTCDPSPDDILHTTDDGEVNPVNGGYPYIGDMNGNDGLDPSDVRYLALWYVGDPDYSPLHDDGDVNGDGVINSGDIRYLALNIAGDPAYTPLYP